MTGDYKSFLILHGKKIHDKLIQKELSESLDQTDWKYCICDIIETKIHPRNTQRDVFHFNESNQTFQNFLHHACHKFNEKHTLDDQQSYTSCLFKRNGEPIAEIYWKTDDVPEQFPEAGIYLKIETSNYDFKQITGIDLSKLTTGNPNQFLLFPSNDGSFSIQQPTTAWTYLTNSGTEDTTLQRNILQRNADTCRHQAVV